MNTDWALKCNLTVNVCKLSIIFKQLYVGNT